MEFLILLISGTVSGWIYGSYWGEYDLSDWQMLGVSIGGAVWFTSVLSLARYALIQFLLHIS